MKSRFSTCEHSTGCAGIRNQTCSFQCKECLDLLREDLKHNKGDQKKQQTQKAREKEPVE